MKREGKTKGKKTKIWLAAVGAAFLLGIAGLGGGETDPESADRNMPATEAMAEVPENGKEREGTELVAEVSPTMETEVKKGMVAESTATPEPTTAPTSTPAPTTEPTPEPTATPAPTPEPTSTPKPTPEPTATPAPMLEPTIEPVIEKAPVAVGTDYILNKNTKKFHYTYCNDVKKMKDKNKKYYTGTREECIGMGYEPCGNCKP